MPTIPGYTVWFGILTIQALALYIAFRHGQIRKFWDLYLYFGLACAASSLRFAILEYYGFKSNEYVYVYYYSDTALTLSIFVVVLRLFAHAFNLKTWNGIPLRLAVIGVTAVALFSYSVAQFEVTSHVTRFVVQLSQNLFFAFLILTTASWIATLVKKMRGSVEVNLVWVFTIYLAILFSAHEAIPSMMTYRIIAPEIAGLWLVAGSALSILSDEPQFG